jgi:hypothetical protein
VKWGFFLSTRHALGTGNSLSAVGAKNCVPKIAKEAMFGTNDLNYAVPKIATFKNQCNINAGAGCDTSLQSAGEF